MRSEGEASLPAVTIISGITDDYYSALKRPFVTHVIEEGEKKLCS